MKKNALLHTALSELIASLGHGDMIVIGDAGLPIPSETRRIDLALCRNVPPLLTTVQTIVSEMQVERAIIAEETEQFSPYIRAALQQLLPATPFEEVTHTTLKELCRQARAVVRTGECTPYANVILVAGVVF